MKENRLIALSLFPFFEKRLDIGFERNGPFRLLLQRTVTWYNISYVGEQAEAKHPEQSGFK